MAKDMYSPKMGRNLNALRIPSATIFASLLTLFTACYRLSQWKYSRNPGDVHERITARGIRVSGQDVIWNTTSKMVPVNFLGGYSYKTGFRASTV